MDRFDVVIVGAGAAGMMCAIEAGKRGRRVLVVDHAAAPGEKIRISGGGRCNFTNLGAGTALGAEKGAGSGEGFLSRNPRFALSALRRYTPQDFLALVERHGIAWHEKAPSGGQGSEGGAGTEGGQGSEGGQLFCDGSARQIVDMLLGEMQRAGATLRLGVAATAIERTAEGFTLLVDGAPLACGALVIATGGKSIPKMGATGFAYEVAARFGLEVVETRPALVPLTFETGLLERLKPLAGVAAPARIGCGKARFEEAMLFTHRGISGPAVLQISSYWREGLAVEIDMAPGVDLYAALRQARTDNGRQGVSTALAQHLPKRLAQTVADAEGAGGNLADASDKRLRRIADAVNRWRVKPVGSEGYRTAEVTLGGVDTAGLDQRTLMARAVPGLHFVGEAVDVTGWLGGYNFQWAWASGWCAGQAV